MLFPPIVICYETEIDIFDCLPYQMMLHKMKKLRRYLFSKICPLVLLNVISHLCVLVRKDLDVRALVDKLSKKILVD